MKREEVKKLFQSESFMVALNKVNSMESLQDLLFANGVKMSLEDMDKAIKKGASTELSESELSYVAGGSPLIFKWIKFAWDCFMFNPTDVY